MADQPDPRIETTDFGAHVFQDEAYLIHDVRGCPKNAFIEMFDGYLRCSSCFTPLTQPAANRVLGVDGPTPWRKTGRETREVFILRV